MDAHNIQQDTRGNKMYSILAPPDMLSYNVNALMKHYVQGHVALAPYAAAPPSKVMNEFGRDYDCTFEVCRDQVTPAMIIDCVRAIAHAMASGSIVVLVGTEHGGEALLLAVAMYVAAAHVASERWSFAKNKEWTTRANDDTYMHALTHIAYSFLEGRYPRGVMRPPTRWYNECTRLHVLDGPPAALRTVFYNTMKGDDWKHLAIGIHDANTWLWNMHDSCDEYVAESVFRVQRAPTPVFADPRLPVMEEYDPANPGPSVV